MVEVSTQAVLNEETREITYVFTLRCNDLCGEHWRRKLVEVNTQMLASAGQTIHQFMVSQIRGVKVWREWFSHRVGHMLLRHQLVPIWTLTPNQLARTPHRQRRIRPGGGRHLRDGSCCTPNPCAAASFFATDTPDRLKVDYDSEGSKET